jgi:hypothetical protein
MSEDTENQVIGLSILVQLSRRVRESATAEEIGFIAVNESKQLLSYRQSALWMRGKGVFTVSGIPEPDRSSPYLQWLTECCKRWQPLDSSSCCTPEDLPGELSRSWHEWAPLNAAIAPLKSKDGETLGMLILFRDEPWHEHELSLLSELAAIYAHGFTAHAAQGGLWRKIRKNLFSTGMKTALLFLVAASLFYPKFPEIITMPRQGGVYQGYLESVADAWLFRS